MYNENKNLCIAEQMASVPQIPGFSSLSTINRKRAVFIILL